MAALSALGSGLAGACALTALHETTRRTIPDAPRMDVLGMRAIRGLMRCCGQKPPSGDALHELALGGDVVSNTLYYSLVGTGNADTAPARGLMLGIAAGVGAVVLPGPLGLGTGPSSRTFATQAMTVGMYALGGLAAGWAFQCLMQAEQR